jgi:hypothetical protein
MKTFAKLGYLAAACALLVATFSIVGPRVVRAAIATLIRDADHPARHAFKLSCTSQTAFNNAGCALLASVPGGQEYVIQGVSVSVDTQPQTAAAIADFEALTGSDFRSISVPLTDQGPLLPGIRTSRGVVGIPIYADPGSTVGCIANSHAATNVSVTCVATGYWVSLP